MKRYAITLTLLSATACSGDYCIDLINQKCDEDEAGESGGVEPMETGPCLANDPILGEDIPLICFVEDISWLDRQLVELSVRGHDYAELAPAEGWHGWSDDGCGEVLDTQTVLSSYFWEGWSYAKKKAHVCWPASNGNPSPYSREPGNPVGMKALAREYGRGFRGRVLVSASRGLEPLCWRATLYHSEHRAWLASWVSQAPLLTLDRGQPSPSPEATSRGQPSPSLKPMKGSAKAPHN